MKKRMTALLAGLMAAAMLCTSAFAAGATPREIYKKYTSRINNYSVQGVSFDLYTDAHYTTQGSIVGNSAVWIEANSTVPSGTMQARAFVMRSDGVLFRNTGFLKQTAPTSFLVVQTNDVTLTDVEEIIFGGQAILAMPGGDPVKPDVYSVRYKNGVCSSAPPATPGQPMSVNSQGLTYGTLLDRDSDGSLPDLLGAVGVDGNDGYVLRTDFDPTFYTSQGLERCQARWQENNNLIPLYDEEMNQTGWYAMDTLELAEEPNAITREHMEELSARNLPMPQNMEYSAFQELNPEYVKSFSAGLVDGDFPRNAKGETFGTILNRVIAGYDPDWIAYVGDNGVDGYMRFLDSECSSAKTVDLYDMDGNIVDQFTFRGTSSCG